MITIAGAGLAGLACAYELAQRGAAVRVYERATKIGAGSVSRYAGGMLAPWCERESAEEEVITLGGRAIDWWAKITPVHRRGTLVVVPARDRAELTRFARRTSGYRLVDGAEIAALEPALKGRFAQGLFFEQEAHLDPRRAIRDLAAAAEGLGAEICLGTEARDRVTLDCTGMAAPLPDLRPVRGEMAILHCPEVEISRTLRLLHPRLPLYLVPRGDSLFMIGGTMIESTSARAITLRSLSELLNAAFTLHPAFAEASVVETGAGLRPAFPDNLPRLHQDGGALFLNGLYRHGFLLAPAMAQQVANRLRPETQDENHCQRQTA
ncbi:FAD-dependent oxidoreductase [Phaeobacter gallaeciensis]|uniref:Glycine oxidase n=1 Tax=Phaeobacter gallaeciensis TaxID=60890 RepID=A0AAC9ZAR8_9RHOB|nr:FAD-dependent oxidoreductase [Phaeobacter gallaeciensis]AHD10322.1 glycine oxidase [Phaeobacter gallaeciensis DSM 26640]ATE93586.1 glycine oxidase [Phaeobacter gallaeciensis]ATE96593.1 glycine oxidase [Phaeobacter gallaeciensis]ATF02250.1 glycine oxidase [Phaeobacter gallaeciensis]ATF06630.1 glycine oxidase [Phaeobacter gallaeciensis]